LASDVQIPIQKHKKNKTKQGSMIPAKVDNFTIMNFSDSEVDEIPDKEFSRMITRWINEIKEDTNI
jgi:hypothetical protein